MKRTAPPLPPYPYLPGETKRSGWRVPDFQNPRVGLHYGLHLFDRGFYYEAHEVWEGLWKKEPEPSRKTFLQGLILGAASLLKERQGQTVPAEQLRGNAMRKLTAGRPLLGSKTMIRLLGRLFGWRL